MESLLFTDGSVLRSSDPAVARAGWAFSDGRGSGCFGALPGYAQTSTRAELYAGLACASAHQRQLIICTDPSYVTRGAASVARGDWPATNGDLWEGFEALPVRPALLKVPAHLDPGEAALRGLPEVIRQGNADADSLARRGASAPVTPPGVEEQRAVLLALGQRVQDAQWRILQAILRAERRPFGASRCARRFHAWRGRAPRAPARVSYGAHQVVPSGTAFVCLLCQRTSAVARPRAWRYRLCLPRVRRPPNEASASHYRWETATHVGCHLCGRTSGKRWKSRLLTAPCLRAGPRALPRFERNLRTSDLQAREVEASAFPGPLGPAASIALEPVPPLACWPSACRAARLAGSAPGASVPHLIWAQGGRVGCLACRRSMRSRDRHRLLSSACTMPRLVFRGLAASTLGVPLDAEGQLEVSSVELSGSVQHGLLGPSGTLARPLRPPWLAGVLAPFPHGPAVGDVGVRSSVELSGSLGPQGPGGRWCEGPLDPAAPSDQPSALLRAGGACASSGACTGLCSFPVPLGTCTVRSLSSGDVGVIPSGIECAERAGAVACVPLGTCSASSSCSLPLGSCSASDASASSEPLGSRAAFPCPLPSLCRSLLESSGSSGALA
ncbi:MAG: hypothetical protein GY772_18035, partial [bacterium]|nr:hypothetical protein [bacterium]